MNNEELFGLDPEREEAVYRDDFVNKVFREDVNHTIAAAIEARSGPLQTRPNHYWKFGQPIVEEIGKPREVRLTIPMLLVKSLELSQKL